MAAAELATDRINDHDVEVYFGDELAQEEFDELAYAHAVRLATPLVRAALTQPTYQVIVDELVALVIRDPDLQARAAEAAQRELDSQRGDEE